MTNSTGLFVDNPSPQSKLVVYGRKITKEGIVEILKLKVFEMPLAQLGDNFELMVTVENTEDEDL